jgi:predicted enzyme related to lactoylglutathione lyase
MQKNAPPYNVSHFSINADDVDRAMSFYSNVFGWTFTPWGPPGFFLINAGDGIHGSLQQRPEPLTGTGIRGYECSISVEDVDKAVELILANGGSIKYPKTTIPTVGDIAMFWDPEGNYAGVARYDPDAK